MRLAKDTAPRSCRTKFLTYMATVGLLVDADLLCRMDWLVTGLDVG